LKRRLRAVSHAPYADVLWCETSTPDQRAKRFADAIREISGQTVGTTFAVVQLEEEAGRRKICEFQQELGYMGCKFQFVTLAGFHAPNMSMFHLARCCAQAGMTAYRNSKRVRGQEPGTGR
jgi:isocitrate lyase